MSSRMNRAVGQAGKGMAPKCWGSSAPCPPLRTAVASADVHACTCLWCKARPVQRLLPGRLLRRIARRFAAVAFHRCGAARRVLGPPPPLCVQHIFQLLQLCQRALCRLNLSCQLPARLKSSLLHTEARRARTLTLAPGGGTLARSAQGARASCVMSGVAALQQ